MKYETESCIFAKLLQVYYLDKIKNLKIKDIKYDFVKLKNISKKKNIAIPKKYSDFKKLLNSDNFNRFKCIFLPFDAVVKALNYEKYYSSNYDKFFYKSFSR